MPFNREIHNHRSIRLKGYDYSGEGLYFVTICCHNRECLFGEILYGEMVLNDAGKIADGCWLEIPNHFPNAVLHEYIVMPNHVHGIIELKTDNAAVAAVWAKNFSPADNDDVQTVGAKNFLPLQQTPKTNEWAKNFSPIHESPPQIVWQRNYHCPSRLKRETHHPQ